MCGGRETRWQKLKLAKTKHWTVRCADLKEQPKRPEFFLKLESANIMKNRAFNVRKNPKQPENVKIPSERTVYRIMEEIGICHQPGRKPNGITKADREARKSEDLLKRDFHAKEPLKKCVTDITEIKASDGKLYVSAVFDCFDSSVLGLAMDTTMKATLCVQTLENTAKAYPGICGAIIHSDRGSQYTSQLYRDVIRRYGIRQSMNSGSGRCHDNARCESMWARMKQNYCMSAMIRKK